MKNYGYKIRAPGYSFPGVPPGRNSPFLLNLNGILLD